MEGPKRCVEQVAEDMLVRRRIRQGRPQVVGYDPDSGVTFVYVAEAAFIWLSGAGRIDVRDDEGVSRVWANVTDVSQTVARWIVEQSDLP